MRSDRIRKNPSLTLIVLKTAEEFGIHSDEILQNKKGRGCKNNPRKIAMYLSQKIGDYKLKEIASFFGLCHYGSVSSAICAVVEKTKADETFCKRINLIINRLDP